MSHADEISINTPRPLAEGQQQPKAFTNLRLRKLVSYEARQGVGQPSGYQAPELNWGPNGRNNLHILNIDDPEQFSGDLPQHMAG